MGTPGSTPHRGPGLLVSHLLISPSATIDQKGRSTRKEITHLDDRCDTTMLLSWKEEADGECSAEQNPFDSFQIQETMTLTRESAQHILLVDDDLAVRQCVRQFLELQGYSCTEADNGAMALEELARQSFSLIITDNQMPTLDGISFLETYFQQKENPTMPVIIVTGHLTPSLQARAAEIGVTKIFEKPCSFEVLSDTIATLI